MLLHQQRLEDLCSHLVRCPNLFDDGQISVFGKNSKIGKTIQHMADQEKEHIDKFNDLIIEHRIRPTALLPVWNIAGFALGASTAMLGEKAAMACTVAVIKEFEEHGFGGSLNRYRAQDLD